MRMLLKSFGKILLGGMALALMGLAGCGGEENVPPSRLHVLASFPPLFCFAKEVGGDDAEVECLMTSTGPHNYQPNARDVLKLRKADLFLINGLGLDDKFLSPLKDNSGNPEVIVRKVAESIPANRLIRMNQRIPDPLMEQTYNPYVWMGLDGALAMIAAIRDELVTLDPQHGENYERRASAFIKELEDIQTQARAALKVKTNRKLVTTHDSLSYFSRDLNLEIVGVIHREKGVPVPPMRIEELVNLCEDHGVRVIATELQFRSEATEMLRELLQKRGKDIILIELDLMETSPTPLCSNLYTKTMKKNIDTLVQHLR